MLNTYKINWSSKIRQPLKWPTSYSGSSPMVLVGWVLNMAKRIAQWDKTVIQDKGRKRPKQNEIMVLMVDGRSILVPVPIQFLPVFSICHALIANRCNSIISSTIVCAISISATIFSVYFTSRNRRRNTMSLRRPLALLKSI